MEIRDCEIGDLPQIRDIYNHYIEHTTITFEETPLEVSDLKVRFEVYTKSYPWLVCCDQGQVIGYAYACKWKVRMAYRNTAEATIYLRAGLEGNGHGNALFGALLERLEAGDCCHVVLGCVALPNPASVRLQERFGFHKVAHFTDVGRKFGQWLDVGYWQKTLGAAETRSQTSVGAT